jgi:hypothetical protein
LTSISSAQATGANRRMIFVNPVDDSRHTPAARK